jgi:hypothetical protein
MRPHDAAPVVGTTGSGYCFAGEVQTLPEFLREVGITGLFFSMPKWWQDRRIRELSRVGLSADVVAVVTNRGLQTIREALEAGL